MAAEIRGQIRGSIMENKGIKVLVIDDEDDYRQLMTFWLESKGYSALSASNGESGVRLAKDENPDIIFMDLRMPVMDGPQTIAKIREFNADVPIIIISAYLDDTKIKEATIAPGIAGVFYKGKDFSQGLILLESALRTHKKLRK